MSQHECLFCRIATGYEPASKVYEDEHCLVFLDLFPIREGHVLVIPKQHGVLLEDLDSEVRAHLIQVCEKVMRAQKGADSGIKAHNLMLNDGKAANQHIPHVHFHLIPRKGGDVLAVILGLVLRMKNIFGQAARRRRLDEMASLIARHMDD